jgi:hypothetical protein
MFTTHSPYYDDLKAAYVEREAPREAKGSQGKPREAKGSQGKPREAKGSQGKPRGT